MEVDIMTKTKQLGFEKLSNEALNDIIGGGQIWDAIFSPFQSTPSWVQGRKHETTGHIGYIPGGGSWVGGPGL